MEPIKIKVFRHSDLPEIFGYNPLIRIKICLLWGVFKNILYNKLR